ncbi:MAG: N-methyl-L-tryptophan oxidase [Cytophagaceae bacterium]|nr:N-methyl-L-tryptophan oxidase [Gemmatimonadaceae bacterium]
MTSPASYDVAVVGLGAMGSSAALHLARRGLRVLGIDRFAPPHDLGSSHGRARLIREAYYEDPLYVPLVRRAYELWRALEHEVAAPVLHRTGAVMIGAAESELIMGTRESAIRHDVPHELLDAKQLHQRFPVLEPLADMVGVFEPGASILVPETIVGLQVELASRAGATLVFGERVMSWEGGTDGVELRTDRGTHHARQVVCCAGAWTPGLVAGTSSLLEVERQVQQWWAPARKEESFGIGHMPVTLWELANGRVFYTMPDMGQGLKVGWHHSGAVTDPDRVERTVSPEEHAGIADLLRRFTPAAKGDRLASQVCLYTNTPDRHFIVDRLPGEARVLLVSACSGHGFKFASVIGEVVADLVTSGRSAFDLTPFRLARFSAQAA